MNLCSVVRDLARQSSKNRKRDRQLLRHCRSSRRPSGFLAIRLRRSQAWVRTHLRRELPQVSYFLGGTEKDRPNFRERVLRRWDGFQYWRWSWWGRHDLLRWLMRVLSMIVQVSALSMSSSSLRASDLLIRIAQEPYAHVRSRINRFIENRPNMRRRRNKSKKEGGIGSRYEPTQRYRR
jgi:hypothetical protein